MAKARERIAALVGRAQSSAQEMAVKPIAVIDIGSNSVRLVVYDGLQRSPQILFNEKVMCGLGKALSATGLMSESSVACAVEAMARFAAVLDNMNCTAICAMATAAVRDAQNGGDFIAQVKARTGIEVTVLDGAEEARYSALGVVSGIPGATGIVGDLGGGSLELIRIENGELHERTTLPIGPVRMLGAPDTSLEKRRKIIDKALKSVEWLRSYPNQTLYIVGGAWRALARIHMQRSKHPLRILHQYAMSPEDVNYVYRLVRRIGREDFRKFDGVPQRRVETLPAAARILDRTVAATGASNVVVSALGLREGILFEQLEPEVRDADPLLAACAQIASRTNRFGDHSKGIMEWIEPAFSDLKESEDQRRLRLAATMMSDISWRGHPDFRAEQALYASLFGWFVGIDAPGRAAIGLALFTNYGASPDKELSALVDALLSPAQINWAIRLGCAMRLAHRLSGGTAQILEKSGLRLTPGGLSLLLERDVRPLYNEVVQRRLNDLAAACNVDNLGTVNR